MTEFEYAIAVASAVLVIAFVLAAIELVGAAGRVAKALEVRNELNLAHDLWLKQGAEEARALQRATLEQMDRRHPPAGAGAGPTRHRPTMAPVRPIRSEHDHDGGNTA